MADRVSATIRIGGRPPVAALPELIAIIEEDALGPEWDAPFNDPEELAAYAQTTKAYAALVRRYSRTGLIAAATQDWMCEDLALRATGLTAARHQALTIDRFDAIRDAGTAGVYLMPVLQGREPDDYRRHLAAYGARIGAGAWVGASLAAAAGLCQCGQKRGRVLWALSEFRRTALTLQEGWREGASQASGLSGSPSSPHSEDAMSAFVLAPAHIRALVNFAFAHGVEDLHTFADQLNSEEPARDGFGRLLVEANVRSIQALYSAEVAETLAGVLPVTFDAGDAAAPLHDPLTILHACQCYDFQACEVADYGESWASLAIGRIRTAACSEMLSDVRLPDSMSGWPIRSEAPDPTETLRPRYHPRGLQRRAA